ncbi:acetyl-CoA hydrolase/transferase family protein [Clostridium sp. Cult1]|uniref:acetyl-CoA hydrolase/transferase family protein n=1 Tax=Clostridium sp. Cult1 TaxID=2079002 RepID=UPI001F3212B4|nr:acetyl-CoA hydrolase/transferase C-terminal domain-containing protein [Clostridium sp. Cult1]MCF6463525.1 4-hydroxybutyrate--acetyl-CoA CoA transferase [Clostridium sp. Cult1]
MSWKKEYNNKKITVDDALNMVKSNYDIVVGLAASEPMDFLNRLHEVKDNVENVNVLTCLNMGNYEFTKNPDMYGHFTNLAWFYTPLTRKAQPYKTASFIPNHLHLAAKARLDYKKPNVFMATVSPMDKHGYFSLSLSLTYEREFLEAADIVILEVNENYPRTYGDTFVHINDVDYLYESNRPVPELPVVEPSEKDMIIGGYISELVDDGSTIQLGIGGIPNAVAKSLINKKDLGIHTEMFTDGMVDLYEAGVITNKKKSIHKGKSITTFALGSKKLYDFIDDNPGVELKRGAYTNDPYVVGQNYKMVSINTSLQLDLTGQVCSESLGHIQYSGTGGQADTAIGSQMSPGGKSIIALYSTAKKDTISTIVPLLTEGAAVSLSRNDVDYVVTEYGVAPLRGREIRQRVNNLIAIAHPDFRSELQKKANELMLW